MKKSIYSIVLMDDVVEAIDEMAYRMNTSRSNLINQILAEHVSYVTPERRTKDIFDYITDIMDSHFQIQSSDAILSIRSPLRFRYKPTIRYKVELLREITDDVFGFLTISFRTQSEQLINALNSFFKLWDVLENRLSGGEFTNGTEYDFLNGKILRKLKFQKNEKISDNNQLGIAIGNYIRFLDSEIKIYFANIDFPEIALQKMELFYQENADAVIV